MFVFVCVSHYVSSYCIHYYSFCDSCLLWCITHHCDCYNSSHISLPNSIMSAGYGSATMVDTRDTVRVLLAPPGCCSNNLSPRCLLRHMPTILWALLGWLFPFIRVEPPNNWLCCILMSVTVFTVFSGSCVAAMISNWGSAVGVFTTATLWSIPLQVYVPFGSGLWLMPGVHQVAASSTAVIRESFMLPIKLSHSHSFSLLQPFGVYPCRYMYLLVVVFGSCQVCTKWQLLLLLWLGRASCYPFSCPPAIPSIWWGIQVWDFIESPSPSAFPTWWGIFFSRLCSTQ